jgi:hypothetical protein
MGFKTFDNLGHKLYRIEGKLLGPKYTVYRVPDTGWLDWKSDSHIVLENLPVSFAFDNAYMKNPDWAVPKARAALDGRKLQTGDILYNEEFDQTYYLLDRELNRPFDAIQVNKTISIHQLVDGTEFKDTGSGWGPAQQGTGTLIADNIPAAIIIPYAGVLDSTFVGKPHVVNETKNRYNIYFTMGAGLVKKGALITFDGTQMKAESVFDSPAGYKVGGYETDTGV